MGRRQPSAAASELGGGEEAGPPAAEHRPSTGAARQGAQARREDRPVHAARCRRALSPRRQLLPHRRAATWPADVVPAAQQPGRHAHCPTPEDRCRLRAHVARFRSSRSYHSACIIARVPQSWMCRCKTATAPTKPDPVPLDFTANYRDPVDSGCTVVDSS